MKKIINWTVYLLFFSILFLDGFLGQGNNNTGLGLVPHKLTWLPEILSCLIAMSLCTIYAFYKKIYSSFYYILFFLFLFIHLALGIVANGVSPGPIIAGIRRYFACIPLFLLPLLCEFSEKEIEKQLKFLLICAIIQCPVAVYQRFYLFRNSVTGDYITGTLSISSILSIYQICCMTMLAAFFLKKRIKLPLLLLISLVVFLPTTLNETKGTIILFPIAIFTVIVFSTGGLLLSIRKYTIFFAIGLMIILVFIPLTDHFRASTRGGEGLIDFFTKKGRVAQYLYKSTADKLGEEKIGRIDALLFPFKKLSGDPLKLLIGLGMGNVSPTGIGAFKGEYLEFAENMGASGITAANLIWETGLIGLLLYYIFFAINFAESFTLRKRDDVIGAIALGWIPIIVVLSISFFYKNIINQKIWYLFAYFSGVIASKRAAMQYVGQDHSQAPIASQLPNRSLV